MKKIVLQCIGVFMLLFGLAPSVQAQDYTITSVEENLTDLSSVDANGITVALYNKGRDTYLHLGTFENAEAYCLKTPLPTSGIESEPFIFKLIKDGDYYKFQDCAGNYIPAVIKTSDGTIRPSETAGLFEITSNGTDTWAIKNKDNNLYFNGNGNDDKRFAGWDNGTEANSQYEIKQIDVNTTTTTYNVKIIDIDGNETTSEVTSKNHKLNLNLPQTPDFYAVNVQHGTETLTANADGTYPKPTTEGTDITVTYSENVPFEASESYETAKWYIIQMHNNKNESFVEYKNDDEIIGSPNKDFYKSAQYWCFVGNIKNGYKLYNKVAGATKAITFHSSGRATMADSNSNDAVWQIAVSKPAGTITNGDRKFVLKTKTTDSGNIYLNMDGNKILTFWKAADDGSTMVAYSVEDELQDLVQEYEDLLNNSHLGAVGTVQDPEAIKAAIDGWKKTPSAEGLSAIQNMCADTVSFDPTLYYRIENVTRKRSTKNTDKVGDGGYLEFADKLEDTAFTGGNFFANDKGSNRASAIWKFELVENTTDTYNLCNLNSKQYIMDNGVGHSVLNKSNSSEATNFKLVKLPITAQFKICNASTQTNRLHVTGAAESDGGNLIIHDSGEQNSASAWYIIPATTINVTITDALYATVNYPFAVQLPGGLTAYTASSVSEDNTKLLLKKVSDGFIPANTPVVLQGAADTYALTIVPNNATPSIEGNLLEGTTLCEEAPNEKVFVLGKIDNEVGFYKLNETEDADRTMKANKAYLPESNLSPTIQATRGFIFSFNDDNSGETTTGIENATVNLDEEEFYDLQGRRVMNPTKGIYVTKSGKKILFTK